MTEVIQKKRKTEMVGEAGLWDKARLQAMSAPRCGSWLEALPSRALDLHLTNDLQAYIIEINRGPGMESHCVRDDYIRQQMLDGYIDIAHGHNNTFMVKL